jgi:single stranded DNA-binding protein
MVRSGSLASARRVRRAIRRTWDRLAEICGQFVTKGQLVDVEGRLQTRQWDDDAGKRHWKTEVVVSSLEMLSGRAKKDYAREAQAAAAAPESASGEETPAVGAANGAADEPVEALVAM